MVIDAYARVSLVGIELLTIDARLVISSVDTYLRFAEATNRLDLSDQGRSPVEMFTDGAGAVVEKVASDVVEDKVEGAFDAVGDALGEPVEKVARAAAGKVMAVAEDLTTRATRRAEQQVSTAVRRQDETFRETSHVVSVPGHALEREPGERVTMSDETDRIEQLEQELDHLMHEVERYRSAAEDALQQVDWCIGYFHGARKGEIARVLSSNRAHIRREYMRRSAQEQPVEAASPAARD